MAADGGPLRRAFAFVLAGGREARFPEPTDRHAEPAVSFGGEARSAGFAGKPAAVSGVCDHRSDDRPAGRVRWAARPPVRRGGER